MSVEEPTLLEFVLSKFSARTTYMPDGTRCASMHDDAGRRGIWYYNNVKDGQLGIVAGREGDDAEVLLKVGQTLTAQDLYKLNECLDYGAWMQEDNGPGIMTRYQNSPLHIYQPEDHSELEEFDE